MSMHIKICVLFVYIAKGRKLCRNGKIYFRKRACEIGHIIK